MEKIKTFSPQSITVGSEILSKLHENFQNLKDKKDSYEIQMRDSTKSVEYRAIGRDNFLKSEAFLMGVEYIIEEVGINFDEEVETKCKLDKARDCENCGRRTEVGG